MVLAYDLSCQNFHSDSGPVSWDVVGEDVNFMENRTIVTRPEVSRPEVARPDASRHIIIRPEPHPVRSVRGSSVAVPEGGSTVLFIFAAVIAMGWAATKRYCRTIS